MTNLLNVFIDKLAFEKLLIKRGIPRRIVTDIVGVSFATLSSWENGKRPVSKPDQRSKLLGLFNCEFDELFETRKAEEG